jgi:intracellular sulfur oxidation DsrE/DsrF family protein
MHVRVWPLMRLEAEDIVKNENSPELACPTSPFVADAVNSPEGLTEHLTMTNPPNDRQLPTARRGFVGRLLGGTATIALFGTATSRVLAAGGFDTLDRMGPDDDWMEKLKGKHRTVFDLSAHRNGKPLTQAKNYLDAWRDAFKVPERDLNLIVGVHGDGIPIVLNDSLWAGYKIGEQYEILDGGTKSPGVRNVFSERNATAAGLVTPEQSVEGLQKRGVRFIICMNTIAGATKKLSAAGLGGGDEIRTALMGGFLPDVRIVPAMVVALTQLQERGVKYVKIA